MASNYEKAALKALLEKEHLYAASISRQWQETLASVKKEMEKIYAKYAVNGKLTKAQMTQYNRYAEMEKSIMKKLNIPIENVLNEINRLTPSQYQEAFFRYAWAVDQNNGVRLNYGNINPKVVIEATASKFKKISLKTYGQYARATVRKEMLDGLTEGKSYAKMAKDLENAFNINNYRAQRIVRTEGQTILNQAADDIYLRAREEGIEGAEVWDATLDSRTRPDHGNMDGKIKNRETGVFDGPGGESAQYPGDPNLSAEQRINCRCHIRFEVVGYAPQLRRTRDQGLIPYQTFDEWKMNYGNAGQLPTPKAKPVNTTVVKPPKPAIIKTGVQDSKISDPYYKKLDGAKLISSRPNPGGGVNRSYMAILQTDKGRIIQGILKPSGWDPVENEYASFLLDRELGINRVPNVLYKEFVINGKKVTGTFQEFFNGVNWQDCPLRMPAIPKEELKRVATFDWLTNNTDRHSENWMVSRGGKRIAAIDNGRAFRKGRTSVTNLLSQPWEELNGYRKFEPPKDIMDAIDAIDIDKFAKKLEDLGIDQANIIELKKRIKRLRTERVVPSSGIAI